MRHNRLLSWVAWLAPVAVLVTTAPALGAGFGIFEQGTKAMGMAGAFTAQADDASAMFHNVGGLAFLDEREFLVGFTYITATTADFKGADPFPGQGYTAEQETLSAFPPHFYWAQPIGKTWRFGLAVNAPFGLSTEWKDPDEFLGRFVSTMAALQAIDLNPNMAVKVGDKFGFGFGLIARFSEIELQRRNAIINPFTAQPVEVAETDLTGGYNQGYGFQLGFLHRYNESFHWGISYRSQVKVEYDGDVVFRQISTGNPLLDGVVAATLPFGSQIPIATEINFPDMASIGVMIAVARDWRMELDINWTGWSSFDELVVTSDNPVVDLESPQNFEDVMNYRLGAKWLMGGASELRFGIVYDENPQPDTSVSPLLPDSDRLGYTIGYGAAGKKMSYDLALMYLTFDERTTLTNQDGYNGTYSQTGWLLGLTVGF